MSDEQNKLDEEQEVEGHVKRAANDEPTDEAEGENEVEGHMKRANVRLDAPKLS
jgi:hypothetical protein